MIRNIEEYISRNPESYLGYYCKGLTILDTYFDKSQAIESRELTSSFKIAADLIRTEESIKYYFLSLLIAKEKRRIKWFRKYMCKLGMPLSEYNFKLIISTIQYFKKWHAKPELFKKCGYFDSIDYLILYVLDKEYKIKIVQNCNYIYESMERGRKSKSLLEAMFKLDSQREIISDIMVRKYPAFLERAKDFYIFKIILQKGLIERVEKENAGLVEKVIGTQIIGNQFQMEEIEYRRGFQLVENYIRFCIYSGYRNFKFFQYIENYLRSEITEEMAVYLYWNGVQDGAIQRRVRSGFMNRKHLSKVEVEYLQKNQETMHLLGGNLYHIEVKVPMKVKSIQINIRFIENELGESFEYYVGMNNYYRLLQKPIAVVPLIHGNIIGCEEGDIAIVEC